MASIVLSSVGASLGNALLPGLGGIGGRVGSLLGRRLGSALDDDIGWFSDGDTEGARLENLRVQDSRYGLALPIVYGRVRIAGNVIWASELIETAHREKVGGGKGGGSSLSRGSRTTYSYSVHCAIALAVSPALGRAALGGIATIWADSKIIYQNGSFVDGVS